MKRLDLSREPQWLRIDEELELLVRRPTMPEMREIIGMLPQGAVDGAEMPADQALAAFDAAYAVTLRILSQMTEDWTVADDSGRLPVTAEAAEALLMQEPMLCGAITGQFVAVFGASLVKASAEKNGSAPSPNGSTAGAPNTAATARGSVRTARGS